MTDLEGHLFRIASRELGESAPQSTVDAIHESIDSHHLWEANGWLIPLLQRLVRCEPTDQPVEVPWGYPAGESGLANLLADLDSETWLHVEDYGEWLVWRLPVAGIELFVSREGPSSVRNCHTYAVRRAVA